MSEITSMLLFDLLARRDRNVDADKFRTQSVVWPAGSGNPYLSKRPTFDDQLRNALAEADRANTNAEETLNEQ